MKARKTNRAAGSEAVLPPNRLQALARENCARVLRGGMAKTLGLKLTALTPKKVVAEMKLLPRHLNHNGRVNGGAIMAFADLLGAIGAGMHRPAHHRGGTLESKTNFFAAGVGPAITGVCVPLHVGRTTSVWQTTVTNADGRTIAIVTQTQMSLPGAAG